MAGVGDADVDGLLAGTFVAPLLQPCGQPGATAGRVDDEIGGDDLVGVEQDTGDSSERGVVGRFGDGRVDDVDVLDRQHAPSDLPLQLRPAGYVGGELVLQPMGGPQHMARGPEVDAVRPVLQDRHAVGDHVFEQAGELALEFLGAARHQQVHMPALRHCRPVCRAVRQRVALVDGHPVTDVGEHPGCAQAPEAGADDDCVFITPPHRVHSTRYIPSGPVTALTGGHANGLADEVGRTVDCRHRRAGHPVAQGPELVGSHRLRGVRGDRRGHLHDHRVDGGKHHRPGDLHLVRIRRDRLRTGRAVLRRVRLNGARRGQRLHLLLRDVR